jgi:hypothetical protein
MTPELGFRARGKVHAHLVRTLAWCVGLYLTRVLPRLPTRWHTLGGWSLDSLSDEARTTMRRNGLLPVPELVQGAAVRPMALPLGATGWLITGYDEVRAVLADSHTFSNDFGHAIGRPGIGRELDPGGLGTSDPPYHTQLRRLLAPEFTAHRLRSRRPRVQAIVEFHSAHGVSVVQFESKTLLRFLRRTYTATAAKASATSRQQTVSH